MKNTDNKLNNIDKKLYKFALYGLSNSGKTCILTAMGMECRPTEEGATCVVLPAFGAISEDAKLAYKNLQHYKASLEVGELPHATPTSMTVLPKYRYTYSDREIGEVYFEIYDYAGELLNPTLLANENEMSNNILQKMRDLDGIIILVTTPEKDKPKSEVPDEINCIIQAFNSLHGTATTKRKTPIALVLTKWDRQSPIEKNTEDNETKNIQQFFETHDSFRNVYNALQNNIGTEHFKIFPVSALGHCENNKPMRFQPLQSYGLPYPFGWLIRQINEMDFKRVENLTEQLPSVPLIWKTWQKVDEPLKMSETLINRLPDNDVERIEIVKRKRQQIKKNIIKRSLILYGIVVCIVLVFSRSFWYIRDGQMLRSAEVTINTRTDAPISELQNIHKRLVKYKTSGFLPFLRPHNKKWIQQTDVLLGKIAEKLETPLFKSVEENFNNKQWQAVVESGNQYKEILPNGYYITEVVAKVASAQARINEMETKRKNDENNFALERLESLLKDIKITWERVDKSNEKIVEQQHNDIQNYIKAIDNALPHPDVITSEQQKRRIEFFNTSKNLRREIENVIAAIKETKDWKDFEKKIGEKFNSGKINDALSDLANRPNKNNDWKKFCKDILSSTENKINDTIIDKGSNYSGAIEVINKVLPGVRLLSNAGMDEATTLTQKLNRKIDEITEKWDKNLYGKVIDHRNETVCKNYLSEAPLKTMTREVEQYQRYIAEKNRIQRDIDSWKEDKNKYRTNEGKVPPLEGDEHHWEDDDVLFVGKKYQGGEWLPVGKRLVSETNKFPYLNRRSYKISEEICPYELPRESYLPLWRK